MTDEHFYPFKKHNIVQRKEGPLGSGFTFMAQAEGGACGRCGFWAFGMNPLNHDSCSLRCVFCKQPESEHEAGWCLFQPTRFEAAYYEWVVT